MWSFTAWSTNCKNSSCHKKRWSSNYDPNLDGVTPSAVHVAIQTFFDMLRLLVMRLMIPWLLSTTTTRAFLPGTTSLHRRSMFVTMSAANTLTGKVCVTVAESLEFHGSAKFLDGSWFLKGRNGREEFERGPRIEGAEFFDIDDIASKGDLNPKNLPHMMPPKELFAAVMDAIGISNDDHIIVYGTKGCVSNSLADELLSCRLSAYQL